MKKSFRSIVALLLAVLTVCSLSAVAFADNGYTYDDDQIYQADENQTFVYTVQVSAGPSRSGAERVRSYMLSKGLTASFLRWMAATASCAASSPTGNTPGPTAI